MHPEDNVGEVLNRASCGDIIRLQAAATFHGTLLIPAKNCDDDHWIVIRTSAADTRLPPEGQRLTPCYGGVASLPGRPAWKCASSENILAKIEADRKTAPAAIVFAEGANHYRFTGLEITREASNLTVYNLVEFHGPVHHIVFDRIWFHGTPQDETVRGIMLGPSRYVAIVDSTFTDFHCIAKSGACTDAQAIAGGLGNDPMGPYKIVNNFLEASGENIMFGGGGATKTPADIEVRHNYMFKPLTWMPGQSGFMGARDGNAFIVKNLFELKNAQRVLVEGNIMEYSWGGFSQVGFGILLTPKNQGSGRNACPECRVTDVTMRFNLISHVGAGLQIANGLSEEGGSASDGQRYSIHDIIIDDIDGSKYNGPGELAQISMAPTAPVLRNVNINHITAFPTKKLFIIGAIGSPMENFAFTNSIVTAGEYPVWSTGSGGARNCAVRNSPSPIFQSCFNGYSFTNNAIIAAPAEFSEGKWPQRNFFPSSPAAVKFVRYNGGNGGDYHLQPSSPYKKAATDGKQLGADIDAIDSAIAGVRN